MNDVRARPRHRGFDFWDAVLAGIPRGVATGGRRLAPGVRAWPCHGCDEAASAGGQPAPGLRPPRSAAGRGSARAGGCAGRSRAEGRTLPVWQPNGSPGTHCAPVTPPAPTSSSSVTSAPSRRWRLSPSKDLGLRGRAPIVPSRRRERPALPGALADADPWLRSRETDHVLKGSVPGRRHLTRALGVTRSAKND
jgi:hypothetical protein